MSVADTSTKVGKQDYWRSLSELEGSPEFDQFLHREFPQAASEFPEGVSRRRWLKLMSASLALGGVAGCRYGPDQIASFVVRPANTNPGIAKHYATNFQLAGRAVHALITNYEGRPLKVDGNANHPLMVATEPNDLKEAGQRFASAGTDAFTQACILGLYDPDRLSGVISKDNSAATWDDFSKAAATSYSALKANGGKTLAILMSPSLSPTVNRLLSDALKALPEATVVSFSSIDHSAVDAACAQAAGQPAELLFDLSAAKVICCFDSDLLGVDPNAALYNRQFSKGRNPDPATMNRLVSLESRYSVTGSAADFRLPIKTTEIEAFLARVEKRLDSLIEGGKPVEATSDEKAFDEIEPAAQVDRAVEAIAEDLFKNKGAAIVSVGAHLPLNVQLGALRLNKKLDSFGKTVMLMPSRSAIEGAKPISLADFATKAKGKAFDTVWILGDNPVYGAPGDIDLADVLKGITNSIYVTDYNDETAAVCNWSVPCAHPLESWGDVRGVDGSYGICQPQIEPLLNGKSLVEIVGLLTGLEGVAAIDLVKKTASTLSKGITDRGWNEALHEGFVQGVKSEALSVTGDVSPAFVDGAIDTASVDENRLELVLFPSDVMYDGRFANNVWLQELPQVTTRLVWDNAALISPATADKLGISLDNSRQMVEMIVVRSGDKQIKVPAYIVPGQANGSIALALGYGRPCNGLGEGKAAIVGRDASPLRTTAAMHVIKNVSVKGTSEPYKLATTQDHFAIDKLGADETSERSMMLIREGTLEQIAEEGFIEHKGIHHPELKSLWNEPIDSFEKDDTVPYQWGMTIDLNKCTGCNSCVIACQSENNVPVVGKDQVARSREMHWLRIDRYYSGNPASPKIVNQPVMCMHCETAPCEQVCPVAATVHTEEGINQMTYNRCVGTRYCGNNCPYKVRRFNYFNYNTEYGYFYGWQDWREQANRKLQQLVLNPDVSVRGRGVMEKCSYCLQRVQNGKIQARNEGRMVEDGEIQSACQVACPTQAIVFGDLKNPATRVSRLQRDPRNYAMLEELNVKPRTLYLARVRNVHPRLKTADQKVVGHHSHEAGEGHGEHS